MSAEFKFPEVFCSQCGEAFGPGDNGFSQCESHAGMFPLGPGYGPADSGYRPYGPADWVRTFEEMKAEASAQAMAEIAEKRRYITESKKPAEDLWMAILAAQGKCQEAMECFLDLHEMAWELVQAEQQRAKEKPDAT